MNVHSSSIHMSSDRYLNDTTWIKSVNNTDITIGEEPLPWFESVFHIIGAIISMAAIMFFGRRLFKLSKLCLLHYRMMGLLVSDLVFRCNDKHIVGGFPYIAHLQIIFLYYKTIGV